MREQSVYKENKSTYVKINAFVRLYPQLDEHAPKSSTATARVPSCGKTGPLHTNDLPIKHIFIPKIKDKYYFSSYFCPVLN